MENIKSNYKINKEIYDDYIEWLNESKFLENQFQKLSNSLKDFYVSELLFEERYRERDYHKDIAKYLHVTLDPVNCNRLNIIKNENPANVIDFDQQGIADGYIIWHFLDRYLRFQHIYLSVFKAGFLPLKRDKVDHLDVGTGPASAIFALSDIYRSIKHFAIEKSIFPLANIEFRADYVENSNRFRNWLHHFTEYANYQNRQGDYDQVWKVPYHRGSFLDAYNTDFSQKRWWQDYITTFNLVTIGNFITEENQVSKLEKFFLGLFRVLKLGGIVILSGGGNNIKYFDEVASLFISNGINHLTLFEENKISFHHKETSVDILKKFYLDMNNAFNEYNLDNIIDPTAKELLFQRMNTKHIKASWKIYLFHKGILPKIYRN